MKLSFYQEVTYLLPPESKPLQGVSLNSGSGTLDVERILPRGHHGHNPWGLGFGGLELRVWSFRVDGFGFRVCFSWV